MSHLLMKPTSGGTPASVTAAMVNEAAVYGIFLDSPPSLLRSIVCAVGSTAPAPRNRQALKKACAKKCISPATSPIGPKLNARNIKPRLEIVLYARTSFRSFARIANVEAKTNVNPPIIASTHGHTPVNKGKSRAARYTPAGTIAALCSNAETGAGPCIALGNQEKNGICADLAKMPIKASTSKVFICQLGIVDVKNVLISTLPAQA